MTTTKLVTKDHVLSWFRKYHKWPSLIFTFFIFLFSVSGIILNHREFFSSTDISRKFMPSVYHYHNWNLAAVKSQLAISHDNVLIYGNIGIWKTIAHSAITIKAFLTEQITGKFSAYAEPTTSVYLPGHYLAYMNIGQSGKRLNFR